MDNFVLNLWDEFCKKAVKDSTKKEDVRVWKAFFFASCEIFFNALVLKQLEDNPDENLYPDIYRELKEFGEYMRKEGIDEKGEIK